MLNKYKVIIGLLAFLAVIAMMNTSDFNDELEYQKHACEMVKLGAWPEQFCK